MITVGKCWDIRGEKWWRGFVLDRVDYECIFHVEGRLLGSWLGTASVSGAVAPERLAPVCGAAEVDGGAC